MLWSVWLLSPALAQAPPDCDGLFALAVSESYSVDCDVPVVACDRDFDGALDAPCSPNEFQQLVYDRPFSQVDANDELPGEAVDPSDGWLYAGLVPKCADGTDDCPAEEQLRCVDGTRPLYWVDPPDITILNQPARWIFTFQGGGSCGAVDGDDEGTTCWDAYHDTGPLDERKKRDQMTGWEVTQASGHNARVGPNLLRKERGIHEDGLPHYANTWRVKVSKCSFDRGSGQTIVTGRSCPAGSSDCLYAPGTSGGSPSFAGKTFDLHFTGRLQIAAILEKLRDGSQVQRWGGGGGLAGGPFFPRPIQVPPLDEAGQIVFAGHSGGAEGLIHNLDSLADHVASWGGEIDVRGLIDARGWPGLNHTDAMFHGTSMYSQNTGNRVGYSGFLYLPPSGNVGLRRVLHATWQPGGDDAERDDLWNMAYDSSCVAALPFAPWRCANPSQILFDHTSTPFFLRQALHDEKHVYEPVGDKSRDVPYATDPTYRWSRQSYCTRVRDQADTFLAAPISPFGPVEAGAYGWMSTVGAGVFLPLSSSHPGMFHTNEFTTSTVGGVTYADALWDWLDGGGSTVHIDRGSCL